MDRSKWALSFALLLGGCLQVEESVEFDGTGAGTQSVVMSLPQSTLDAVQQAAAANQSGVASDPKALFERETVEAELRAVGLELVRHEVTKDKRAQKVDLQAKFASPSVLRSSPLVGSSAEWRFTKGPWPDTIEVTLFPQGEKAWREARERAEKMKGEEDRVVQDFFVRRQQQLAGLDVAFRLKLPGKVLRYTANLEQTGECEVTAKITAEQIRTPEDLVRRLAPRFQAVFDARDCKSFPVDS